MPTRNSSASQSFSEKVKRVVAKIPKGSVMTYKEVAKLAGNEMAFRAVATIMRKNFDQAIPCHRVIRSDGEVGDYNRGGEVAKLRILTNEGWISGNK
jgi:methylated-DNA-[protein]-cysteine S-methyltransferase